MLRGVPRRPDRYDDGFDESERLDREEEERTCIGRAAGCINPHYSHGRSECETEETVKAYYDEMEADTKAGGR